MLRKHLGLCALLGLLILAACKNTNNDTPESPEQPAAATVASLNYELVKAYPHDPKAFTQGLIWHEGHLYESAGQFGQSNLRKVELASGKVLQQTNNAGDVFGEGITYLGGKIYQLSWQNRKAFQYDIATLKLEKEFPLKTEGWGLTHNGKELIVSDGSSNLYFLEPASFRELRRVGVTDDFGYVSDLNELEYVDGYVYANRWRTNYILKIDPGSGKVLARADLGLLKQQVAPQLADPENDVLNGIAHDSATGRWFVTGKNWPGLFEIKWK